MRGRRLATVMAALVATLVLAPAATVAVAGEGNWPGSAVDSPVYVAGEGNWPG